MVKNNIQELYQQGNVLVHMDEVEEVAEELMKVDPLSLKFGVVGRYRRPARFLKEGDFAYTHYLFYDKERYRARYDGKLERLSR